MTTADSIHGKYVFDAAWQAERERLTAIKTIWDPDSRQSLQAAGVSEGWRCLEVGAGGGSIAAWLCDRVGLTGSVIATDTDTRFLDAIALPNLEARRHDIVAEALEPNAFDLVHARLLLEHLPGHEAALAHMVAALKPGGVIVLEEFDHVSFLPDPETGPEARAVWQSFLEAFAILAERRGLDLAYGRRMGSLLRARGLTDVACAGRTVFERGGAAGRGLLRLSVLSLRTAITDTGAMTDPDVDRLAAILEDPGFTWCSQIMVTATARKL
jgi:SAM-dependent methyltransferase